jgi:hypothetical protein
MSRIPEGLTHANLAQEAEERISKPLNPMSLAAMQEGPLATRHLATRHPHTLLYNCVLSVCP